MASYRFLTAWLLDAPPEAVWAALHDPERWPEWWPGVELVELLDAGDENGVGSVFRNRWRSVLPYTVEFVARTRRLTKWEPMKPAPPVTSTRTPGSLASGQEGRAQPPREPLAAAPHEHVVVPREHRTRDRSDRVHPPRRRADAPLVRDGDDARALEEAPPPLARELARS